MSGNCVKIDSQFKTGNDNHNANGHDDNIKEAPKLRRVLQILIIFKIRYFRRSSSPSTYAAELLGVYMDMIIGGELETKKVANDFTQIENVWNFQE